MGRERRFPPLPATSILELLTLRRTDSTASRDLDLQQDQPPHHRRETLTTSKTKILDSSNRIGNKPDHNNFLSNSNHRDSLSNNSNSNRRGSLSNNYSNNHRDSLSNNSNSNNHRGSLSNNSNSNNHRDSPHPLHP